MAALTSAFRGGTDAAYIGGGLKRSLLPPSAEAAIAAASNAVSAPAEGVNATPLKRARPNESSNICIPYPRLVQLTDNNALPASKNDTAGNPKNGYVTETEDLRALSLAFVMGLRSVGAKTPKNQNEKASLARGAQDRRAIGGTDNIYNGAGTGFCVAAAPGGGGPLRCQQLCSLEYLRAYFQHVVAGGVVRLDQSLEDAKYELADAQRATGALGRFAAAERLADTLALNAGAQGRPWPLENNTLLAVQDLTKQTSMPGADVANEPEDVWQGIFARDFGPFLRGRGSRGSRRPVPLTSRNEPTAVNQQLVPPRATGRNDGDALAFGVLAQLLANVGAADWQVDGIVKSVGVEDASDAASNEFLQARDGKLYNVAVQGPALTAEWSNESTMACLPGDSVFLVLVADVWFDDRSIATIPTTAEWESYLAKRAAALAGPFDEDLFRQAGIGSFEATAGTNTPVAGESTRLTNLRVALTTSTQLVSHSKYKSSAPSARVGLSSKHLSGGSRLGLALCQEFGEYVVGGWHVGRAMDTVASRGGMPRGSGFGPKTAPNTGAMLLNVDVSWMDSDQMAKKYNNPHGALRERHVAAPNPDDAPAVDARLASRRDFNRHALKDARKALRAAEGRKVRTVLRGRSAFLLTCCLLCAGQARRHRCARGLRQSARGPGGVFASRSASMSACARTSAVIPYRLMSGQSSMSCAQWPCALDSTKIEKIWPSLSRPSFQSVSTPVFTALRKRS